MKTAVFLLVNLKIVSASLISQPLYKAYEISKEALNSPYKETENYRRIYGGMPAAENQFPFMVVLVHFTFDRKTVKCSGSLIKSSLVLTAAHCTQNFFPDMCIVIGGQANLSKFFKKRLRLPVRAKFNSTIYNTEERWPTEFIMHPRYKDQDNKFHDIALVRLQKPFTLPNITIIPLSTEKMIRPMICTILGWGLTEKDRRTNKLYYANAIAIPSKMGCEYVTEGPVICIERGNAATCFGDSGSPLVCSGKAWGVAAYMRYIGKERCGKGAEDYYTEIYSELNWLNNPTSRGSPVVATSKNMFFSLIFVCNFYLRNSLYTYKI